MKQAYYFLEHDGKEFKTFRDLQDWYIAKVKELKHQSPDFNELTFVEEERKQVIEMLNSFDTPDSQSADFLNALFQYFVSQLNKRLFFLTAKPVLTQDSLLDFMSWFGNRVEDFTETALQKKYIESEIERISKTGLDWISLCKDLNDADLERAFSLNEKYLSYIKEKYTNYQHTATASAHEPIVAQYVKFYGYAPTDGDEVLLPEELENRLIIETVAYKHALSDKWMTLQADNDYFRKFIKGTLYTEFLTALYERIRPLNNFEIGRYLTFSVAAFDKFQPSIREKRFIEKYAEAYWHPNHFDKVYESEEKTARYVLSQLTPLYPMFRETTEKALQDHRSNILVTSQPHSFQQAQTPTPALQVQNERMKTSLSVPELALLFKMLSELKPDIFLVDSKEDLFRFISTNFATKKSSEEGISVGKLRTLFSTPEMKSFAIWEQHFRTILVEMKKIKENLSK